MRADRLLALLMYLQTRGRTTTGRLSEELEVSRRTIVRDLYALRVAGFPVCTERGPHGGVSLHEDYRMRLTDLTHDELAALFMTSIPAPLVELGVAGNLRGAFLKLAAALSDAQRAVHERVRQRMYLDTTPWDAPQEAVAHLPTVYRAVREDRWLEVVFSRASLNIRSERTIAPYGLVAKATTWYVVWAGEDNRFRVDRVSRVIEAELTDRTFTRSESFELDVFWKQWCDREEHSQLGVCVTLRARDDALPHLRERFGQRLELLDELSFEGWRTINTGFPVVEQARAQLLRYGGAIEVVEPKALRLSMADYAQQIAQRYH
jgi:predicted DNA-binding transcriptional regulator YafY